MHYYQHHIGDYLSATTHLTLLEHGAYLRLMMLYYQNECALDANALRMICARTADEVKAAETVLAEFFEKTEKGWIHRRCDDEIASFHSKSTKASASARARWDKKNADAMRTHSEGNANHKPENHKPENHEEPKNTSAKRAAVLVKHVDLVAEGLSEQTAAELLASRKRHRADLTPRAWEGIKREFGLAGLTLEQGVGYMLTRGWRSFEAKWLDKQQGNGNGPQRQSIHEQRAAVLAGLTGRSRPKQPEQQGLTIDGGFAERVD